MAFIHDSAAEDPVKFTECNEHGTYSAKWLTSLIQASTLAYLPVIFKALLYD